MLIWYLICLQLAACVWGNVSCGVPNFAMMAIPGWCCYGSSTCCGGSCCSSGKCCFEVCCPNSYDYVCSLTFPYCKKVTSNDLISTDPDSGFPFWVFSFLVFLPIIIYFWARRNGASHKETRRIAHTVAEHTLEIIANIQTIVQPQETLQA